MAASFDVCFWHIPLQKSFRGDERNFLELLMRFVHSDVRDHIVSLKNDHGTSYRRYRASQPQSRPKNQHLRDFDVVRFSTFATLPARSRHVAMSDLSPHGGEADVEYLLRQVSF